IAATAVNASKSSAVWVPTAQATATTRAVSNELASKVEPAKDEQSFDTVSKLERGNPATIFNAQATARALPGRAPGLLATDVTLTLAAPSNPYPIFTDAVDPIDEGTATVVRLHADALARLREFNKFVVDRSDGTPSVESLIVTTRLALIRDYATKVAETNYP